jgi:hypothetical protein
LRRWVRIAVAEAREQFGNRQEEERPLMEDVTKGLVETRLTEKTQYLL